ncbi:MAG TPA: sigma-70 family RNA polymerase sigma factor [Trebonia sp.]
MRDDPSVVDLVARAADGDRDAWDEIVDRFAPLLWSICLRYRLSSQDSQDVGQTVWLLLVEQLGRLREPAALPGWLATTTQRECLRVLRRERTRNQHAWTTVDDELQQYPDAVEIDEEIIAAEWNMALRAAFAELPAQCQRLLGMLISDPPSSYAEISATLQIAVGSIGPQRARCLQRMRRSRALTALTDEATGTGVAAMRGEASD